jgi:hypothetical protein
MRTPHICTNEQEAVLWSAYLRAKEQREVVYSVSSRFYHLEDDDDIPVGPGVAECLRSLLRRGKELRVEYEQFRDEIDAAAQTAAWAYAGYVADLHYGDQIEASSYRGRVVFHCQQAMSDDSDPDDFRVSGSVARKDGSPGTRSYGMVNVFSDDWKLKGRANAPWLKGAARKTPVTFNQEGCN